ncbi:MAG: hypothetical protein KUG81_02770, partial [Gammaproteobacteria bacterium]|nr:hypothetical protein [Gammaproteobacteria bacterium]
DEFVPHIDQKYKIVFYPNATDADNNTFANAVYNIDLIEPFATSSNTEYSKNFATLAAAVADTGLADGDALNIAERTTGNGGGAMWDVVLSSTVTENTYNIVQCTGVGTLSIKLRENDNNVIAKQWGAIEDGATDDTDAIGASIEGGTVALFSKNGTQKITAISLNDSVHLRDANVAFSGLNAGFDIDTAIDGLSMKDCILTGDGVLSNDQKGITSNSAITNGYFENVHLISLVQGFDLNSAVNPKFIGGLVKGSVGEAAGEGYGIIAGSSIKGGFVGTTYEECQRHALYLNNALYATVTGNTFYKHRDGLATGGGLGALQIAGHAKGVAVSGNTFAECTGPEIVISPQPANTETLKSTVINGNTHTGGQSANIRIGGATPSATENVEGLNVTDETFMPDNAYDGSIVQLYSGRSVSISDSEWHVEDGAGTTLIGVQIGLTTPDDLYFDNISISGHKGILTKLSGNAIFVKVASELCLGTTRIDIFDNEIETDVLIDYATTPTNPNIRTDDTKVKSLTLASGNNDINVAGFNVFSITGNGAGSNLNGMDNAYDGKVIELRFNDLFVTMAAGGKKLAGSFTSSDFDVMWLKWNATDSRWDEQNRSVNS